MLDTARHELSVRARVRRLGTSPLAWTLAGVLVLFALGLGWGLPASDPWDNDGVAPRDFLVAVSQTFARDRFDFAYLHLAPLHLLLLTVLTAPVTLPALASAGSTSPDVLVRVFIDPRVATPIAWVARAVSVAMGVGVVLALAKVAEELRRRPAATPADEAPAERAAVLVAALCGTNGALVYYAHATNLEVPYLFWGSWALLALVRAIVRREPRRLRGIAVLGALAIGSKDQAAGLFLLGAPASLLAWVAFDAWARERWREVAKEALVALAVAAGVFLVADEVVLNPTGFAARVRFLFGPASQDWTEYSRDTPGRLALLHDIGVHSQLAFPAAIGVLGLAGVLLGARTSRPLRAAYLAPLFSAISFTLCVNLTAYRTEDRFILPQTLLTGLYAGMALDELLARAGSGLAKSLARLVTAFALAAAAWHAAGVDAVLLFDPRYDAEAWMRAHVGSGDTVETYGGNVYLPRFPPTARVERIDPDPTSRHSPLPGLVDRALAWEDLPARHPRWISLSRAWAWRYLEDPPAYVGPGHAVPVARTIGVDAASSSYFRALLGGRLGYRVAHTSEYSSRLWAPTHIHASTGETVWILERQD
jgi:hypothetical protein